jgi:hypothetical protein
MIKEEIPYRGGVERLGGNNALFYYLLSEQVTNVRRVNENRVLSQAADIAKVTYIPADKGMIIFPILLMDFVQVASPVLAIRQSGETLPSYAASAERNH